MLLCSASLSFFFCTDTATTEIYTLSLHDALPISWEPSRSRAWLPCSAKRTNRPLVLEAHPVFEFFQHGGADALHPEKLKNRRSEEHTSELQSQSNLVCRLLLEKKNKKEA